MNALDADGKLLVDSRRTPAARDMYVFVVRGVVCIAKG